MKPTPRKYILFIQFVFIVFTSIHSFGADLDNGVLPVIGANESIAIKTWKNGVAKVRVLSADEKSKVIKSLTSSKGGLFCSDKKVSSHSNIDGNQAATYSIGKPIAALIVYVDEGDGNKQGERVLLFVGSDFSPMHRLLIYEYNSDTVQSFKEVIKGVLAP